MVEKEDWRSIIDLVTNAKQVVSSVQDVAAKLADYAKFRSNKDSSGKSTLLCTQCANATLLFSHMCYNFCTVNNPVFCSTLWCCGV